METTLFLTLKKVYFDQIKEGSKKEEYREIKPWSDSRLIDKHYDFIEFMNGYSKGSPRMIVEYLGYYKKLMNFNGKFQEVYAIRIGEMIIAN